MIGTTEQADCSWVTTRVAPVLQRYPEVIGLFPVNNNRLWDSRIAMHGYPPKMLYACVRQRIQKGLPICFTAGVACQDSSVTASAAACCEGGYASEHLGDSACENIWGDSESQNKSFSASIPFKPITSCLIRGMFSTPGGYRSSRDIRIIGTEIRLAGTLIDITSVLGIPIQSLQKWCLNAQKGPDTAVPAKMSRGNAWVR